MLCSSFSLFLQHNPGIFLLFPFFVLSLCWWCIWTKKKLWCIWFRVEDYFYCLPMKSVDLHLKFKPMKILTYEIYKSQRLLSMLTFIFSFIRLTSWWVRLTFFSFLFSFILATLLTILKRFGEYWPGHNLKNRRKSVITFLTKPN